MTAGTRRLTQAEVDALLARRGVGSPEHVELWEAINDVVVASGGSASCTSVARQKAVVRVENAVLALMAKAGAT